MSSREIYEPLWPYTIYHIPALNNKTLVGLNLFVHVEQNSRVAGSVMLYQRVVFSAFQTTASRETPPPEQETVHVCCVFRGVVFMFGRRFRSILDIDLALIRKCLLKKKGNYRAKL